MKPGSAGKAGAHEDAAIARDQRKDVARGNDILAALAGVDRDSDGPGAVPGGDSGRNSFARLDRDGEGGFMPCAVVAAHQFKAKLLGPFASQRQANQPAAVHGHEVDRIGRGHLRWNDQVTLVLAVFVIDQDEHPAVTGHRKRSSLRSVSAVGFQSLSVQSRRVLA